MAIIFNRKRAKSQVPERLKHALANSRYSEFVLGSVYIVQCNEFVKIGFAYDVPARICNLQIGCPYPLVILREIPSMTPDALEGEIHASVEQYRVRGEWFKLPPDVLSTMLARL